MQSVRHAYSSGNALAHRRQPAGFFGVVQKFDSCPGISSSKLAHAALCKDLMNLLHVSVVCRELQFCEQNQEFEASQLPLQKCVCRVYTCLTLLLLQQVHLSLLMLQARTRSQAFHEKR